MPAQKLKVGAASAKERIGGLIRQEIELDAFELWIVISRLMERLRKQPRRVSGKERRPPGNAIPAIRCSPAGRRHRGRLALQR